jgi:serine/threonine protein kinase
VWDLTGGTGSFVYMAPEVFLRLPYNEKADVYSFAMVMYELLGGVLISMTSFPTTGSKVRGGQGGGKGGQ